MTGPTISTTRRTGLTAAASAEVILRPAGAGQSAADAGLGPDTADARAAVLEPDPDVLLHIEVPDELVKYYLSLARAGGMVYALAVKQLISRLYRDHDYVRRRQIEGRHSGYDELVRRDSQALSWLLSAAALYVPLDVKRHPIPPRPPKPKRATPKSDRAAKAKRAGRAASGAREPAKPTMVAEADGDIVARVHALLEQAALVAQPAHEGMRPGHAVDGAREDSG